MPEGIEVGFYYHNIKPIVGGKLINVEPISGRYAHSNITGLAQFRKQLPVTILGIGKKGKFMWLEFDKGWIAMITFGMTGSIGLHKTDPGIILSKRKYANIEKYVRVVFEIKSKKKGGHESANSGNHKSASESTNLVNHNSANHGSHEYTNLGNHESAKSNNHKSASESTNSSNHKSASESTNSCNHESTNSSNHESVELNNICAHGSRDNTIQLIFADQRNFGTIKFTNDKSELEKKLSELGYDITCDDFALGNLRSALSKALGRGVSDHTQESKRKGSGYNYTLGMFMISQKYLSGSGTYLTSEILFKAGMKPQTKIKDLTHDDIVVLHKSIKKVVKRYTKPENDFLIYKLKFDYLGHKVYKYGVYLNGKSVTRNIYFCKICQK
jgi:formamidopyrimidine-DNA glycosylase